MDGRLASNLSRPLVAALALWVSSGVQAGGIDHAVDAGDATGIFKRNYQLALQDVVPLVVIGTALWQGDDSRLGHNAWQATDSLLIGEVTAAAMKVAFTRARPSQSNDSGRWFQGAGHYSFPSGEVMEITTAVTPFILEYGAEHPAVWALGLLPVYDAIARVRSQAHWQTDVLASLVIGTGIGYYAHSRPTSLTVGLLPRGITIGWKKSF
ncbi:MAG: phosphatase PAP2 family protein [Pseudomonadota bacterium]|nr:phosphatase PAP2 family protein [Pseudomonadota bacterium]